MGELNYQRLTVDIDIEEVPTDPGAYEVCLLDESGCPIRIERLIDSDSTGCLYIGAAPKGLRKRLGQIRSGSHKDFNPKMAPLIQRLEQRHGKFLLCLRWGKADSSKSAYLRETKEMDKYFGVCGELPPLNRALPKFPES